jgi:CheY-like chemotaxis protein
MWPMQQPRSFGTNAAVKTNFVRVPALEPARVVPPRTVLLADDDPNGAYLLQLAFVNVGVTAQLKCVVNGEPATCYLEGRQPFNDRQQYPTPGLLILDLNMSLVAVSRCCIGWDKHRACGGCW